MDVFHDDRDRAVVDLTDGLGSNDVWMVQPGHRPRLTSEALDRIRIIEIPSADGLDGDDPVAPAMAREIDRGHTALAKLSDELVLALQRAKIGRKVDVGGGHWCEKGSAQ